MYILEVDDDSAQKSIQIKFPGAPSKSATWLDQPMSGYYLLKVETEDEGMWDYANCQIQTIGEITDI